MAFGISYYWLVQHHDYSSICFQLRILVTGISLDTLVKIKVELCAQTSGNQ